MTPTQSLYRQVVHISSVYLGPAADRFITRQITYHLRKRPEDLQIADLPELISWIRLAMSFLTDDQKAINEYTRKLRALQPASHRASSTKLTAIKRTLRKSSHAASA